MYDLKRFRQDFSLTQKQLADMFDCNQSNISAMEKTMRDLEAYQRDILIERFGNDVVDRYVISSKAVNVPTGEGDTSTLPAYITYLLPMSAMGGSLSGFAENGATLQDCEKIVSPVKDVDFAITVNGDSMSPEYPSGSRILIKKIDPSVFIDWGKTYVLDTSNGVIVKEVHKSEKEGFVKCHSVNPDPKFADFDVPLKVIYGMYRVLMCLSMK